MYGRIATVSVDNTVVRTVAKKVIDDLKNNLDIDNKAFIALSNVFEQNTFTSGVNVSLDKNSVENPIAETIEARIDVNKLNGMTTQKPINEEHNIFKTKDMRISTEFVNHEMVITIIYKTKSKVNADRLKNYLEDHYNTKGAGFLHMVEYYYIFPKTLTDLLVDVYSTGVEKDTTPKTLAEYIQSGNYKNAITGISDVNGVEGRVGLAALATTKLHGMFENDLTNINTEHERDKGDWSVSMEYKLNFMIPRSFIVDFEISINNKLIDEKWLEERTVNPEVRRKKDNLYDGEIINIPFMYDYAIIPPFDNHTPYIPNNKHIIPMMSVLTVLESVDTRNLFNLNQLYYYSIDESLLDYIKENRLEVVRPTPGLYHSLILLDLYKDGKLQARDNLEILEDLTLRLTRPPEMTSVYRIVLSIVTNKNLLTKEANKGIEKFGDKIDIVFSKSGDDYRLADRNTPKELMRISDYRTITSQISVVNTFVKENKI